jgi:hypothetical protein
MFGSRRAARSGGTQRVHQNVAKHEGVGREGLSARMFFAMTPPMNRVASSHRAPV